MRLDLSTFTVFLVTITLPACQAVTRTDLGGEYIARYSFGTDRIILREDGTYLQEIVVQGDPEEAVQTGKWEYDSDSRGPFDLGTVYLYGCLGLNDGFGGLKRNYRQPSSICSFPVERESLLGDGLRLGPDEGHPHKRE
jgi:hypothetical protein